LEILSKSLIIFADTPSLDILVMLQKEHQKLRYLEKELSI